MRQMTFARSINRSKGIFKNINERVNIIFDIDSLNIDEIEPIIKEYIFNQNIYIVAHKDTSISTTLLDTITNNINNINVISYAKNQEMTISCICGGSVGSTIIVSQRDIDSYKNIVRFYEMNYGKLFVGSELKQMCQKVNKIIIRRMNKQAAKYNNYNDNRQLPIYDPEEDEEEE